MVYQLIKVIIHILLKTIKGYTNIRRMLLGHQDKWEI